MQISVVITYFKKGKLLLRATESALGQLDLGDELIIIDDGSEDVWPKRALELGLKAQKSVRLRTLSSNEGPGSSKNQGIAMAAGDIIALLDADDQLPNGTLAAIRKKFITEPEADFIFGDYVIFEQASQTETVIDCGVIANRNGELDVTLLARKWVLLGSSPFRKNRLWPDTQYDLTFPHTDDMDFWRKAITRGAKGTYLNQVLYRWNVYPLGNNAGQTSENLSAAWIRHRTFYKSTLGTMEYFESLARNIIILIAKGVFRRIGQFLPNYPRGR